MRWALEAYERLKDAERYAISPIGAEERELYRKQEARRAENARIRRLLPKVI
jgi:hypothetical protein